MAAVRCDWARVHIRYQLDASHDTGYWIIQSTAHSLFVNINSPSPRTYLEIPDSPRFRLRCRALPSRDTICFATSSLVSAEELSSWVFTLHLFRNLLARFYRRVFFMFRLFRNLLACFYVRVVFMSFTFHLFRYLLACFNVRVVFMSLNVPSISSLFPADDLSSWDF